jgi:hypothetical protein
MQQDYGDSNLSISQRAYLIADSLRQTTRALFSVYMTILFGLLFGILVAYTDQKDTGFYRIWLPYIVVATLPFVIFYSIRARQFYRKLRDWNEDYLEQAYILLFTTTVPKGNDAVERVLNLASQILPELSPDYLDLSPYIDDYVKSFFRKKLGRSRASISSKSKNYKVNSYTFDLVLKTPKGYFIVKVFRDKVVTPEDLKGSVEIIQSKFRDRFHRIHVLRVICVAREYDQSLLQQESLERTMKDLRAKFKIDLLIEEQVGFSVLWVG